MEDIKNENIELKNEISLKMKGEIESIEKFVEQNVTTNLNEHYQQLLDAKREVCGYFTIKQMILLLHKLVCCVLWLMPQSLKIYVKN